MELSLFGSQGAPATFQHYIDELTKEINSKPNDYVLEIDKDEWKQYFIDKYDFPPITLYPEDSTTEFTGKGKRELRGFEVETYRFEYKIPFTGWNFLFGLIPTRRRMDHPTARILGDNSGFVCFDIVLVDRDDRNFESAKKQFLDTLVANSSNINNDLADFKTKVANTFDTVYEAKKKLVLEENEFFERLNIKIEPSTETIFKAPVIRKKKIPEPIVDKKTPKKYIANPTLEDGLYDDILSVINALLKSVEKKPSIYRGKDEESLRDYILPFLETRYDNSTATGETFNKNGKTDILIRYKDGTNLFVAECKFWKGEAVLHDTIDQLFDGYLTWRDSKVAIIFFVKNKDFSNVLDTIAQSVVKHKYFKSEKGHNGESSFSYLFHFPDDTEKNVFTEIMAFHFPE